MIIFTIFLLVILEVSLSFDNAVLNSSILTKMPLVWQKRFLTWGILIAVLGMRLVFPILIVYTTSGLQFFQIIEMAVYSPQEYGAKLIEHHVSISSFGGMFLLMLFLDFVFDNDKQIHWIKSIEKRLSEVALLKGIEIVVALTILILIQTRLSNDAEKLTCVLTGIFGIILYMLIKSTMGLFRIDSIHAGLLGFIYLEILDASCSLDGVIGAFALTNNIFVIMIGLGVGAFVIRSLTLYLVLGGTLKGYIYLEHGAHYGIGALAIIMLISTFCPVPESITGIIGIAFIGLSLLSSIREKKIA